MPRKKQTSKKRASSKKLIVKTHNVPYKFQITWQDFIPPIFIKLYNFLRGYITSRYIQITYIDLGISIIFMGTILVLALTYLVVPRHMADAAEAFYLYTHRNEVVLLRPSTLTKANLAKSLFMQYKEGIVLGVQESTKVKSRSNNKEGEPRLLNMNKPKFQNADFADNYETDAANYYSYYWRFN